MVDAEPSSEFTRIRRQPARAAYDREAVHTVLDTTLMAHVGFVDEGRPIVIPMLFGRDGEHVYLHGSVASRLQRTLAKGIDVCLTVTIVDGLVFAALGVPPLDELPIGGTARSSRAGRARAQGASVAVHRRAPHGRTMG